MAFLNLIGTLRWREASIPRRSRAGGAVIRGRRRRAGARASAAGPDRGVGHLPPHRGRLFRNPVGEEALDSRRRATRAGHAAEAVAVPGGGIVKRAVGEGEDARGGSEAGCEAVRRRRRSVAVTPRSRRIAERGRDRPR